MPRERLPYISVLTNPTTAGVMASFASLGDVIMAEPEQHDRFRRPARDQGNDAPGFAGRFSDRRVPGGTRPDRSDRASQKNARADRAIPRITFPRRSERGRSSRPCRRSAATFASYQEALAWLYGTQLFGIKLGLENMPPAFRRAEYSRAERAHHSRRRHERQRLRLRDDRFDSAARKVIAPGSSPPLTSSAFASAFRSMAK